MQHKLVKMRTMVKNGLPATAFNAGVVKKRRLGPKALANLAVQDMGSEALNRKRDMLAKVNDFMEEQVAELEGQLAGLAGQDEEVERLRKHPGIGLMTSLALVHTLKPANRFSRSRKVAGFVGFDPTELSSGEKKGYGGISKAGSALLRFLLGQAAQTFVRKESNDSLSKFYRRIAYRRDKSRAKVAVARKLLVRCWIMLRDGIDYAEFCRRGQEVQERRILTEQWESVENHGHRSAEHLS